MKNWLALSFLAVLVAAFSAVAQAPPHKPASRDKHEKQEKQADEKKTVTMTGCLQQDGTTERYVLVNPQPSPEADADQNTRYALSPPESVNLKDYVGHKVEVTGTIVRELARTDPGAEPAKESPSRVDVIMVKEVSSRCP